MATEHLCVKALAVFSVLQLLVGITAASPLVGRGLAETGRGQIGRGFAGAAVGAEVDGLSRLVGHCNRVGGVCAHIAALAAAFAGSEGVVASRGSAPAAVDLEIGVGGQTWGGRPGQQAQGKSG